MEHIPLILSSLLTQAPRLIIWIIGCVLAIILWKRHPVVSALALIAFGGSLVLFVVDTYISIRLPSLMQQGLATQKLGVIYILKGVIFSILDAIFGGLLVVAIFGWRKKDQASAPPQST